MLLMPNDDDASDFCRRCKGDLTTNDPARRCHCGDSREVWEMERDEREARHGRALRLMALLTARAEATPGAGPCDHARDWCLWSPELFEANFGRTPVSLVIAAMARPPRASCSAHAVVFPRREVR